MATKSDAVIKLVLVFVISLLSFAVGTFVGKKYSDQQHKIAAYEPTSEKAHDREVASEKEHGGKASGMSDEEIAKLAEEFVTDDTAEKETAAADGHHEKAAEKHAPAKAAPAHGESTAPVHATAQMPTHDEPMKAAQNLGHGKPVAEEKPVVKEHRTPANLPTNVAQYPAGKFTVQVASFSTEDDAKKRAEELKSKGYGAFYLPAQVNGKTWFRVSVGQFPTEQEAKNYRADFMQKTKIESAIIQKIVR